MFIMANEYDKQLILILHLLCSGKEPDDVHCRLPADRLLLTIATMSFHDCLVNTVWLSNHGEQLHSVCRSLNMMLI
jgi:hypothetical protein